MTAQSVNSPHEQSRATELKVGAVLSYVGLGMQFVVAMLYTPIMLRLLGQTEYGLYNIVGSIVSYLSLLSFGLGGAYLRFYARFRVSDDSAGIRRLNGTFLIVFTAIALVAAGVGAFMTANAGFLLGGEFAANELRTGRILFAILTFNLTFMFPFTVFDSYILAHERFIFQKSLQILKTVVSPLAILPVLLLGHHSIGLATATTIVNVVFTAATAAYSWFALEMRFQLRGFDFALLREVSAFSGFIFINLIVDQVNWNVDKFIVGRFRGAAAVAVYGIGSLFSVYYLTFSTAISSVFAPRVNEMVARNASPGELSELFTRVGRLQFLVLGLVASGFAFFGRPFITLWAGRDYTDAYLIALLLIVPVTIPLVQNLGIEIQKAMNMHHFRSWVYLGVAIVNVLLSIPLARRYGGVGAAAATAIALVVGNGLIINWHYRARVRLDVSHFWRQILGLSFGLVPGLAVGIVAVMVSDLSRPGELLVAVITYGIAYVGGMWWLGMNDYERAVFVEPLQRIFKPSDRS